MIRERKPVPANGFSAGSLCLLLLLFGSCIRMSRPRAEPELTGIASWYGSDFHGKQTSCKEIYNMFDMTAAHRTLPFHTLVEVTNLVNNQTCVVRINDRGPFVDGRIIDLSYSAALALDMAEDGIAPVRLRLLSDAARLRTEQRYFILVGSYLSLKNAKAQKEKLSGMYDQLEISEYHHQGQVFYRVKIIAANLKDAERTAGKLRRQSFPALIMEEHLVR